MGKENNIICGVSSNRCQHSDSTSALLATNCNIQWIEYDKENSFTKLAPRIKWGYKYKHRRLFYQSNRWNLYNAS